MARPPEGRYGVGGPYPRPSGAPPPPNFGPALAPLIRRGAASPQPVQGSGGSPIIDPKPLTIDEILARNAGFLALQGQYGAEHISDAASRDAALRRALIDFGMAVDPSQLSPDAAEALRGVLDPQTRTLIDKNTASGMSILARLNQNAADTRKNVVDSIAGRQMTRTGETGYGLRRAQMQADQQRYDATKQVLDYIAGVQAGFVEAERQRLAALEAARQKAISEYEPPFDPRHPAPGVEGAYRFHPGGQGTGLDPGKYVLQGLPVSAYPKPPIKPPPKRYNPPGFIGGK